MRGVLAVIAGSDDNVHAGVDRATDSVIESWGSAATEREGEDRGAAVCEGVFGCKVDTGNDGTIGAAAVSVKDFDAMEEGALGDAKVCTTDGTSAVGTIWKEYSIVIN